MNLFKNPAANRENDLTEEDIKALENQGCGVAELRIK